ncbi:hypothetical protein [Pedococcus sp. 2YAF34]|uniref:hypothetical protein n=1 Tax=Pedococcus sp. 2YAF34 TaxID=3233032 RepID=UPI003F96C296
MVGRPEDIRRLARRVALEAEQVREVAAQVSATRSVPWQSATASAFRDSVTLCVLSLHHTAELLDTAARVLLAHASAVQSVVDALPLVGGAVHHGRHRGGDR